jgi:copper homeostasis protein
MTLFEVCVDSAAGARVAQDAGSHRVELCSGLFEGGITPSMGLIETTLRAAPDIDVHVLIRPRGGDFIYDDYEIQAMLRDIGTAVELGAHGVVIGALTAEGDVDVPLCARLVAAAEGRSVTFHRAFDMTRDPFVALESLIALDVARVLTSGLDASALEGAPLLAELVRAAGDRIIVLPGGGITVRNVERILRLTGATEIHFSGRATVDSPAQHRNGLIGMGGVLRGDEFQRRVTSFATVSGIQARAS